MKYINVLSKKNIIIVSLFKYLPDYTCKIKYKQISTAVDDYL